MLFKVQYLSPAEGAILFQHFGDRRRFRVCQVQLVGVAPPDRHRGLSVRVLAKPKQSYFSQLQYSTSDSHGCRVPAAQSGW